MIKYKTLCFTAFLVLFAFANFAHGAQAQDDTRYLVKTNSAIWKKSFNARNVFVSGFTADLSDWQLRVTKLFGIEVEPVRKLNILPDSLPTFLSLSNKSKPNSRPTPADNVSWGVKTVYNDQFLNKTEGGQGVEIAVLDTGVNKNHLDLKDQIKDCKDFSSSSPVVDGKCDDKNGHGTHVIGIIVADGGSDGLGIYGVAPESDIWAYKVCSNNGSCWADDIAAALIIAADNGANIVNLSLGSDQPSQLIFDAVSYAVSKNVLVIAAAGNDGPDEGSIDYPAADPNVIAVGALNSKLLVSDWSARGVNETNKAGVIEEKDIEFAAPGVNIESTWKDGGYAVLSGTSMAAPHVAGLAAKLWQKNDSDPAAATREVLHKLANDILPIGDDNASGLGMPRL